MTETQTLFWICPKTHCKMMKNRRTAFCAKRRETALEGDICYGCTIDTTSYKGRLCIICNESKQVKDELCYKCFKKKFGKAPFRSQEESGQEQNPEPVYTVQVNLNPYPMLHRRLLELAEKERVPPGEQLGHLLHQEFELMEERVTK